jgi:hypothetical protein
MYLLCAFHSRSLEVGNCDCYQGQCGFLVDLFYGIDNSALKLIEDGENKWHSLQTLGVQSEDYVTFNCNIEVCRAQSIDQMFE